MTLRGLIGLIAALIFFSFLAVLASKDTKDMRDRRERKEQKIDTEVSSYGYLRADIISDRFPEEVGVALKDGVITKSELQQLEALYDGYIDIEMKKHKGELLKRYSARTK